MAVPTTSGAPWGRREERADWREQLTADQLRVLRRKATERALAETTAILVNVGATDAPDATLSCSPPTRSSANTCRRR